MTDLRVAVIPAAGRGVRAYPRTVHIPKVLLEVGGKPLLQRNLELVRDELGVREFVLLVGHLGEQVRALLGDGSQLGVQIRYLEIRDPGAGLAKGLLRARDLVDEPFLTMLGDELYIGSNHRELWPQPEPWEAVC